MPSSHRYLIECSDCLKDGKEKSYLLEENYLSHVINETVKNEQEHVSQCL